nr:hypothetical protein HK105_007381 [Polyrhizophydium stewartii]
MYTLFLVAHIVSLVGKSRQFGCAVKPWLLPLGLIVTLSSLIVRVRFLQPYMQSCASHINNADNRWQCLRLLRVFSFIIGLKFLPLDKLKENHFVIAQTVNILIGTIPLIVISAAAPMRIQAVYFDDLDINRWECVGSTLTGTLYTVETVWIGFQFLLLFVFVFLIRSIPPALNDTRQVGGTAAILVMLCGICLLQVSNQQSITTRTMIESVIVAFGGAVVLFMFIVPLIVNVGMGTDMATRFAKRAAQINARVAKHRGSGSRTNNTGRTSKRDSTHRSGGGSGTDSGRHAGAIDTTSSSESETVARSINVETEVMSEQVLMELKSMKSLSDKNAEAAREKVFVLDSSQKLTQWRRASILLLGDPVFRLRIHISAKYEASLGCSRQAPEYIGLGALTHISIGEGMGPASNQMCVLVFTRRRVTVMFKDQNKAQAWVTAISQTTMKICGDNRKLSPSEGVRKMSISWKN